MIVGGDGAWGCWEGGRKKGDSWGAKGDAAGKRTDREERTHRIIGDSGTQENGHWGKRKQVGEKVAMIRGKERARARKNRIVGDSLEQEKRALGKHETGRGKGGNDSGKGTGKGKKKPHYW